MHSKSKINITNNLDKMTKEEAIRAIIMALGLFDGEQAQLIFDRLPKEYKEEAWETIYFCSRKMSLMQQRALWKASMAVDYYRRTLNLLYFNTNEPIDKQAYDDNFARQEKCEKEIQEIDTKTNGALKLPVIEDAMQGQYDYYDQWISFTYLVFQDLEIIPKDKQKAKAFLEELSKMTEEERRDVLVRNIKKSS